MKPKVIPLNKKFIGRRYEIHRLTQINDHGTPAIIIVYGRRRTGKTELLEQTYRNRNILKFEGREGQPESYQIKSVLTALSQYAEEPLLADITPENWQDVFEYIDKYTKTGEWTIYFEEVQWLAEYQDTFVSELKHAWDNYFRHNKKLIIILCGSSASFMIEQVAHSKALYNRSQHEIGLEPFDIQETQAFLKKYSPRDIMDAYLSVGGIPVYLERLTEGPSIHLSLCENSFAKNAFFTHECDRIFISSMAENKNYKKIIRYLSKKRFATRDEIAKHLKISSGKNLTLLLEDLELCQFIGKYSPYNTGKDSKLVRYCITDNYLQFYYKFIEPKQEEIQSGRYNQNPRSALQEDSYVKWLGYAFERFCRQYSHIIAGILGFSGIDYKAGVYFSRSSNSDEPGFQIDLIFDRADNVITICEIKYSKNKISSNVIKEFERKLEYFPNKQNKTIQKVLIASNGAATAVINESYFDYIITLDDFFRKNYAQT